MAFGKRSKISDNLSDYSLMLCGESGIGKTTVISRLCEMEFGEDGYILFNTGDEDGVSAIDGVTYEDIPTYKKFVEVTNDIIKNKKDYPDLKVIIIDTLDQLIKVAEKHAIDDWNKSNVGNKNFKPAKTLNSVEGGFGAGYDVVFNLIYDKIRALDKVGVKTWMICHSKTKDIVDPLTSAAYTTLTSNMAQRYFNDFKTKAHVVGVACIDRTIDAVGTGRKNIINHQEITVNKVQEETRWIVFRDDSYSVDSKSRFAGIVDRIPLDAAELQKALKDAINSSKSTISTASKKTEVVAKPTSAPLTVDDEDVVPFEEDVVDEIDDLEEDVVEESTGVTADEIRALFKNADKETKAAVKKVIAEYGKLDDADQDGLNRMYEILTK